MFGCKSTIEIEWLRLVSNSHQDKYRKFLNQNFLKFNSDKYFECYKCTEPMKILKKCCKSTFYCPCGS